MIVKNEEKSIRTCLQSVEGIVDEIIIVDTGSTDKTKDIAKEYTDKIYDFPWKNHFAAARNFAFDQAKMDYIFWLDADDVLLEDEQKKFQQLKESLDRSVDSVTMPYILEFDGSGNVISSLRRNRLVKRDNKFRWHGAVHEYLEVSGNIINSDVEINHNRQHHHSHRNLRIYQNLISRGEKLSVRDLFYYANELFDHKHYESAIKIYKQFLATKKGWYEDNISACGYLADCCHELGDVENERLYILKSFEYDTPRAEFCCRMGYLFLKSKDPVQAIFWYKMAAQLEKPIDNWGRFNHVCWSWLPHVMLCYCYGMLNNSLLAYHHIKLAANYLPEHPDIIHNKNKLESILNKSKICVQEEKRLSSANDVDVNFQPASGTKKLRITFVMEHMKLCGGVKSVIEYSNLLVQRGHQVFIVSNDSRPVWMEILSTYIQVDSELNLVNDIPSSDVIVTTCWKQIVDCYNMGTTQVVHFEQGDVYIFEFDEQDEDSKKKWRDIWSVPIPIIAVSNGLAKIIEKIFQRNPQIVNYALNDQVFFPREHDKPKNNRPIVMFVGPEQWAFKGIADIFATIKIVQDRGYDIVPIWVTQFKPKSSFDGVILRRPPQKQLGELYRAADIYVCGSHYESFGLPTLEAMTCGCAVVSTRNIGVLEYARHGENCLLANIGEPESIANSIIELLEDEVKKEKLVNGGYKTAENFKMGKAIEQFESYLYGALVNWKEISPDK